MAGKRTCCVWGCLNTHGNSPSLSFFTLPTDITRCSPALSDELCGNLKEQPPIKSPDRIRTLSERKSKVYRGGAGFDAGEPLLLTPLIEANKLEEARQAAYCPPDQFLGIDSFAGYLTVNKEYNAHLWFWYFPVSADVEKTPWIIWMPQAAARSSLYGLFNEIGPFQITEGGNLEEMEYSWGKNHSLLFIDHPVGAGYSFTEDERGFATNQTTIGENLYTALQQFLTIFPELRKAPLTISGESYAGKHIPSLAIQIHWNKDKDQQEQPINLHGLAIGNGFMDPVSLQGYSYFAREVGLVDDRVADHMRQLEKQVVEFVQQGELLAAFSSYCKIFMVLTDASQLMSLDNYIHDKPFLIQEPFEVFIDRDSVRRALHVGQTEFNSVEAISSLINDYMNSARKWIEELLENYSVMCFNGHLSVTLAYKPSVNTYNTFNFSGSEDYQRARRQVWRHERKVAGYYKTAGRFTELMIRNAGQMVPKDQPSRALGMISAFTRGIPLGRDTGSLISVENNAPHPRKLPTQ